MHPSPDPDKSVTPRQDRAAADRGEPHRADSDRAEPARAERTTPNPESGRRLPREIGGRRDGLEPTRYGDWEKNGRCIDF